MIGPLSRVIVFVRDMQASAAFYRDVLGLQPHGYADDTWMSFEAGGCFVSLHKGSAGKGRKPKHVQLVFKVSDVARARAMLLAKGAEMDERVVPDETFSFCNGRDPEGNWFQISSR
jgi:catechol 2,3-dioxygenase-like lactoylglutathione lyase family enzyme